MDHSRDCLRTQLWAPLALASAVVALGVIAPHGAAAQTTQSSTIAEAIFQDAQAHLSAGKVHEACDLFARSQKIEPATGTLLNLAACHEREGKTATAWTEFSMASAQAARAGDKPRAQFASNHMTALEKQLHRVVVEILEPVAGMVVTLDGASLAREAWGTAIPLDPGEHSIEVHADGYEPWVRKVNMGPASGTDRIEVRLVAGLAGAPPQPAPPAVVPPSAAAAAPLPASSPEPATTRAGGMNGKLLAGWVVGGAGVAALGVAGVFGAFTVANTNARNQLCAPGVPCSNAEAFSDDHAARVDQTWMFVTGGVGLAALGVGTYFVVSSLVGKKAPDTTSFVVTPVLGKSTAGLGLEGSF